jgi:hypothetical protein
MILITGASGNVGGEVLKQALAVGLKIRATFQSADKAAKAPAGIEGVIMDYAKPETIRPALDGVEKIFLVGPPVRDLPVMEANFRRDGLEIILSSNRPGSFGLIDLWVSTRPTTHDKWSTPVNLGATINTASQDRAPYLSDDGLTLLFTSDRPGGLGGDDFYMVTRKLSD